MLNFKFREDLTQQVTFERRGKSDVVPVGNWMWRRWGREAGAHFFYGGAA